MAVILTVGIILLFCAMVREKSKFSSDRTQKNNQKIENDSCGIAEFLDQNNLRNKQKLKTDSCGIIEFLNRKNLRNLSIILDG